MDSDGFGSWFSRFLVLVSVFFLSLFKKLIMHLAATAPVCVRNCYDTIIGPAIEKQSTRNKNKIPSKSKKVANGQTRVNFQIEFAKPRSLSRLSWRRLRFEFCNGLLYLFIFIYFITCRSGQRSRLKSKSIREF